MSKVKTVGFNYFKVVTTNNEGIDRHLKLIHLLEHIRIAYQNQNEDDQQKIVYDYEGEPARLTGITVDEDGIYHIWFERLLNYQIPIKTTLHGDSTVIDISEKEYVGHEVNALYDPDTHVFMLQRNRDSLGPTAISQLLNSLVVNHGVAENASLAIILDREARKRAFRQTAYRSIQLKVTGAKADDILSKLLGEGSNDIGVKNVEITLSAGTTRSSDINSYESVEILSEFIDNDDTLKLKVKSKEDSDSKVEAIDLLNQKLVSFIDFNYRESRYFNPVSVYERMKVEYTDSGSGTKNIIQRMR